MSTIEAQIELEKKMVAFGVSRYKGAVDKANEKDRGADTGSSQRLLQEFVLPVSAALQEYIDTKTAGINTKYKALLKVIDTDAAAYIGLRAVFDHFSTPRAVVDLGKHIGTRIEDEAKFRKFREKETDYYETIIRDFKNRGTKNYRHMHRVLTLKAKQYDVKWKSWNKEEQTRLGVKILDVIMQCTNLLERREEPSKKAKKGYKMQYVIAPTQECIEWVHKYDAYAQLLHPERMPLLIPPDPWVDADQGGYYTPQMRLRTALIKCRSKKQMELMKENLQPIMEAVNVLQAVPWRVNKQVFEVLTEVWNKSLPIGLPQSEPYIIPTSPVPKDVVKTALTDKQREALEDWKAEARIIHTLNKERVSKCFQVIRVLRTAKEYMQNERFYYVYYCDFRGRIYSSVYGLSPQGTDFSKALLQFADGKPLTVRGLYWLKIHGANTFGKDKLSYAGREQWVDQNERLILAVASDPVGHKDLWAGSDKPWQFLAFCFEYARYKQEGLGMLSYLPVALDGSCNGLQNFSAMLRDSVGGKATNLIPQGVPADIYTEVADVCTRMLRENPHDMARAWLDYADSQHGGFIPRGLAKRPVMTLPYGSTQQSCREYIYKFMIEEAPEAFEKKLRFRMSVFLTPILWAAINEVVIAARQGMDWIQKCAAILAKANMALIWTTPLGFVVYQDRKEVKSIQIFTELCGNIRLRINKDTSRIDVHKQRMGASPNFIHSMDAAHLMLTLLKAKDAGLTHFACIHDDYGTYAEDTDALHKAIREAFLELYTKYNPLQDFKDQNEKLLGSELPPIPSSGNLDLNQVLDSPYFFG